MGRGMAGAIELARRHWLHRIATRKQPALGSRRPPPGTQQVQQVRRQHHVAVFAAFALLHADQHTFAVDVGDLERNHFSSAQACAIGHAQRRPVLEPWCRIQQTHDLFRTEHHRQLAGLMNEVRMLDDGVSLERDPEKEPQRRYVTIDRPCADAARSHMQLKTSYVLEARSVRRPAEKHRQVLDDLDVVLLRLRR